MGYGTQLVTDYLGFSGRFDFRTVPSDPHLIVTKLGDTTPAPLRAGRIGVQRVALRSQRKYYSPFLQPASNALMLISGLIAWTTSMGDLVTKLANALENGQYTFLTTIPGCFAGCLVTSQKVFLFKTLTCTENVYYRREGEALHWSTDPSDIVATGRDTIDTVALWPLCRGEDVLVYRDLDVVPSGHIVIHSRQASLVRRFDAFTAIDVPHRFSLRDYAHLARSLLVRATCPIARSGRVGVILSGGIDSSAVLAALVENNADVIAYHWDISDPVATETTYAQRTCAALGVHLNAVPVSTGLDYLPIDWRFPLPYNHKFFRWFQQIADRAHADGVRIITSGRFGDTLFSGRRTSLFNLLSQAIPWRGKIAYTLGALSTDWSMSSLLGLPSPHAPVDWLRRSDFLSKYPRSDEKVGAIPLRRHATVHEGFSPQDNALELALWRPHGLHAYHPLFDRNIVELSLRLPVSYRCFPFRGMKITKPVLRLAFSDVLPPQIWQRCWRTYLDVVGQNFCLRYASVLQELLGGRESCLVAERVIVPDRLRGVLADRRATCLNADSLLCAAMTEAFLTGYRQGAAI